MSHVVSIQTKVTDPTAITAACARMNLAAPLQGTAKLFASEATGLIVQLPGWMYPVVISPSSGEVKYDNYEENWGAQVQLHRFMQTYAVEKCRLEARRKGYQVNEQQLQDGSIKVTILEGA